MLAFAKKLRDEVGGGVLTSLALHLLVAALLFLQLPQWKTTPPEPESVEVKVVPPPEPQPKPEPEPEKKEEKAEAPQPQPAPAPAAAAASSQRLLKLLPRSEKDAADSEAAPPADGTTQDAASTPQDSAAAQAKTDAAPAAPPLESKPAVPETSRPDVQSASAPSETAGQAAQQSPAPTNAVDNMPTPQQKSEPTPKKSDQASKPNGSKTAPNSNPFSNMSQKFLPNSGLDPRTAQIVARLSPEERLASLCTSEALAMLSSRSSTAARDAILPNGPAGGITSKTSFNGAGAAFRLGSNWYNLDFKCSVDAGATRVVSFTFKIGGIVPRSEWRARKLDDRR